MQNPFLPVEFATDEERSHSIPELGVRAQPAPHRRRPPPTRISHEESSTGCSGKSLRNRGGLPVTLTAAETSRKMDGTACVTRGAPVLCPLEAPQMGRTRATGTEETFIEMDHYQ